MSRILRFSGLLLGIALVAWLVARSDVAALLGVFRHIGWGFVAIMAARAATVFADCAAWFCLLPRDERPSFWTMLPLRWIGESINTTLPAAQIGGEVVRARLLQQRIAAPARGAASVAVDFSLSFLAQIVFTLLGFTLLAVLSATAKWWPIALCAGLIPGFVVLSREILVRRRLLVVAERYAVRMRQPGIAAALRSLTAALGLVATARAALARSLGWHLSSWFGHGLELWLTLYLMGVPVSLAEATMLESLSLAARSAAFLIPSGWGAQEAALIGLAGLTGLSADTALALGLVKRAREFAMGLPGLAAWAFAERAGATPR